ncbi:hypothetical protein HK100_010030, partial [Physocladia obscura]
VRRSILNRKPSKATREKKKAEKLRNAQIQAFLHGDIAKRSSRTVLVLKQFHQQAFVFSDYPNKNFVAGISRFPANLFETIGETLQNFFAYLEKRKKHKNGLVYLCSWARRRGTGALPQYSAHIVADGVNVSELSKDKNFYFGSNLLDPTFRNFCEKLKPLIEHLTEHLRSIMDPECFKFLQKVTKWVEKRVHTFFGIFTASFACLESCRAENEHLDNQNSPFGWNFSIPVLAQGCTQGQVFPALEFPSHQLVVPANFGEYVLAQFHHQKHNLILWPAEEGEELALEVKTAVMASRKAFILGDCGKTAGYAVIAASESGSSEFDGWATVKNGVVTYLDKTRGTSWSKHAKSILF